jgi:hypothetical protein
MSVFCPDGYVSIPNAVLMVAKFWFPLQIAAPERVTESQSETKPDNSIDTAVSSLLPPQILDALYNALSETAHRLRNVLHRGGLKGYYFENDGHHFVSRDFWATTDADEVMESGIWPFGEPSRGDGRRPLFLKETELDALLDKQPAKKQPLPPSKEKDLVQAMLNLHHLSRSQQRDAVCKLPEFERHHITDRQFREAEKQVPARRGRKPLHPEQ